MVVEGDSGMLRAYDGIVSILTRVEFPPRFIDA